MDKRLKEIVIYILENGNALEPEQREELEALRAKLDLSPSPLLEIERSLRRLLEKGGAPALSGGERSIDLSVQSVAMEPEAADYLLRLLQFAVIDADQEAEILSRAARLHPEGISLAQIQFLAATLIFDESLGAGLLADRRGHRSAAQRQH